jgi:hypothetical protein
VNLYLDDDSIDSLLIRLLRQAGHNVRIPADAGLSGADDAVHLRHAIHENRVLLSHNSRDFENLHLLILDAGGGHPGIFIVRKDNDPRRDMTMRGIVHAIAKRMSAGLAVESEICVLNHWR